ncbi:MAG: cytidylate kinase-like family protein [Lachnospiraceae bacterium]|nr:cytidylate kinase-like family protein [Lachnospiraceae bacterium]
MANNIITISREFGSGGREIGKKLAEQLGVECYDSRLIQMASEFGKVDLERISYLEEQKANPLLYTVHNELQNEKTGYGIPANDIIFNLQSAVIKQLAKREPCIIVGRCADYVLKDFPNVYSVFVFSDMENRVKRIIERYDKFDDKNARALIKREDKKRKAYYNYYTNKQWDDKDSYDICINSGKLGIERCVKLLASLNK